MSSKLILKALIILISLITWTFSGQVKMNEFLHKNPPESLKISKKDIQFDLTSFIQLVDFLPKNHVKDGSEDYTSIIQEVLNTNLLVVFPPFLLTINENGLELQNNSKIIFPRGSILKIIPNNLQKYEILRIHDKKNISLYSPNIIGDKDLHLDKVGEWGMGISIRGKSENIFIYNAVIVDTWGDGIYIGHLKLQSPKNIQILNSTINNTYRNGISITTGINIKIQDILISNSNYNGLKIEPSNSSAIFKSIYLNNITTFNNFSDGLSIGGFSKLLNNGDALLELEIKNHVDMFSDRGMFFGMITPKKQVETPIKGYIKIISPRWDYNRKNSFEKRKFYNNVPDIKFIDLPNNYKQIILSTHYKDYEWIKKLKND